MKARCLAVVGSFSGLRQGLILGKKHIKEGFHGSEILPFKSES